MSTTIDQRVVEMRFDNKNFESNVQTSMSTLDKLKQKLNLTGATKGLEDINGAVKNVNMSGLGTAIDTVRTKFSALEVIGVTALANITNSAVNAGKRIISSLTIEPITSGFKEYEMTLNSVQTTMAATGKTAAEVQAELKKLDEYADKTVYSTADMLNNLPKFTNAGVALETATTAMIGIANATALAGGDASKASIAFYNLGQAIGTGYLTRMDYNSINNAGIATMEWKNQMVEAAIAAGTLKKAGDDLYETGGKTFTLQQLFIDGLQHQWASADVLLKVFGDYGDETTEIGKKAYSAAQDIKTFTQMMESLKATDGTGWKDTWQIIFGDLDGAKALWTGLANVISGVITKMTKWRNNLLNSVLGRGFTQLTDKIKEFIKPMSTVSDAMTTAANAVKNYGKIVDEIIGGKWGNGQSRWDKLTEAGYDWAHAQNLVNEKLSVSLRRTTKYTEEQGKNAKATSELTETDAKYIAKLAEMSDAELKNLGYKPEQIKAFRELKEAAEKLGLPLEEFISKIDEIDGRWLFINSFKNIGNAFSQIAQVIGQAWKNIFPDTSGKIADGMFNLITAFHKFTTTLGGFIDDSGKLTKSGENLKRTFEGLFAAFDILLTVTSGPLGIAFRVLKELLSAFDLDILDVTAAIADVIVKFRDWLDSVLNFSGVFEKIAPYIKKAADAIRDFFTAFKNSKFVEVGKNIILGLANGIKNGASIVWDAIVNLAKTILAKIKEVLGIHSPSTETYEIGENLILGLANGIQNGSSVIWNAIKSLCSGIIETFKNFDWSMISDFLWVVSSFFPASKIIPIIRACANFAAKCGETVIESFKDVLGIHSPSTKFFEIGENIIQGLINGLKSAASAVWNFMKNLANGIASFFKNIDWGAVLAIGITAAFMYIAKKIIDLASVLQAPIKGLGDMMSGIGSFFTDLGKSFKDKFKAKKMEAVAKVITSIAIAIAVLVGAIVVLTKLDTGETWAAIGAIAALATILGGLVAVAGKLGPKDAINLKSFAAMLLGISGSMLLLAITFQKLAEIDWDEMGQAVVGMIVIAGVIAGLIAITNLFDNSSSKVGSTLLLLSASIALLAFVFVKMSQLDPESLKNGAKAIGLLGLIIVGLMSVTNLAGKRVGKIGSTLLKMVAAIGLMLIVAKIAASMDPETLVKGAAVIVGFGLIVAGLIAATRLAGGKDLSKVGLTLLAMSASIAILAVVAKLLSTIDPWALTKGMIAITALGGIVVGLVAATRLAGGGNLGGVATTLMAMSISIGILAGIAAVLGLVDTKHLVKGMVAVGLLSGMMALLVRSTKGATDCMKNLIVMTVAIALLVGAVVGLSFIDSDKLAAATLAVSSILGMFALLVAASKIGGDSASTVKQLLPLLGVVVALTGIITALAFIPNPENALRNAEALSLLMLSFSTALGILNLTGGKASTASKYILPMLVVTTGLAGILGVLAYLDVEPSIQAALALGLLLNTMATAMVILNFAGPAAAKGVGAMALMGLVVGELALILGIMQHFDVQPSIETAASLSTLLLAMSGTLVILGVVGLMGPAAFVGIGALTTLIAALGVVLTALGGLSRIDGFNELIRDGGETLALIGYALGNFVGSIVGGFSAGALSGLPEIGTMLSQFMTNATPFIEGVKTIDENMAKGVASLAGAILALTAADVLTGITEFLFGGVSFADLGTELSAFMTNAAGFISGASSLNSDLVESVKALAETILILTSADVLQGLSSKLFGSDGSSLTTFGEQLPILGTCLNTFATNLGTFDESKVATVQCAANAIKAMAEAANALPNEGGWVAKLLGDNSLAAFGEQLPALGTNLGAFAKNLGTFDEATVSTVTCAANAIKAMAQAADGIDGQAEWAKKLFGDNSLATFGTQLASVGTSLKNFATNLGTFGEDKVATVKAAVSAIKALTGLANADLKGAKKQLPGFGDKLGDFAKDIANFCKNMPSGESVTAATDNLKKIVSAVTSITSSNAEAIASFSSSLKKLGSAGVKAFVSEFTSDAAKTDVKKAGADLINQLIKGIESKEKAAKDAGTSAADEAVDGMDSHEAEAESAGKDLGAGLVKGIKAKEQAAYDAGYALGQKAVQGEKDGQKSNSPSKLTIQAGKWLGEGLIVGMTQMGRKVYNAGSELGSTTTSAISSAISAIAAGIDSDMDMQPTIRPVIDLSEVRAGAAAVNGMFTATPSVGLLANVRSINTMMNRRNQNGVNDDVVSAINDLKKTLGETSGDTYTFGNITYGDDSAVSKAVGDLVRAIRTERRT